MPFQDRCVPLRRPGRRVDHERGDRGDAPPVAVGQRALFAGSGPEIYGQSPSSYPAVLPHHAQNVSSGTRNEPWSSPIPLGKFSFDQLSHFLAIEYPAPADATPEGDNWDTIGQIYSYVRCIISSRWIEDSDFQVRGASDANQIQATEFSRTASIPFLRMPPSTTPRPSHLRCRIDRLGCGIRQR